MQRTLIALRGEGNSGKTTTIRLAYDLLVEGEGGACVVVRGSDKRGKEVRRAILEVDGVRVGIYSLGDIARLVEDGLKFLVERDCVVIVCAARWGRRRFSVTVDVVNRVAKGLEPDCTVVWIEKGKDAESDQKRCNQEKADEVIREVRKAIEKAKLA